jgi:NAD(P)-dependent dehydrogenase (short-subunit alcohol dehydrogenase family)
VFRERSRAGAFAATPIYAASKAAINMMTVQFASPSSAATAPCPGNSAVPGNHHRPERN